MKIFFSLKKSALFIALLCFVFQTNACSNESVPSEAANFSQTDYLKLIPAQTNLLIYANFENLKNTPFGKSIKEEVSQKIESEDDRDYKEFMEKTGIDLERDIHQIWICSAIDKGENHDGGAFIKGTNFDEDKILKYIEEQDDEKLEKMTYDGHTIYGDFRKDDDTAFTFLKQDLMALGTTMWLQRMIDQKKEDNSILDNKDMVKYIDSIQQKEQFWGVFNMNGLSDDWAKKIRSESQFKGTESIEKMKSLYFYTKFTDRTDLFIKGDFTTNKEAELVAEMLIGFKAMAKLMVMDDKEAIDMLNDVKIATEGQILEITTKVDKSFIEKLKEKRNKFAKGDVRLL